MTSNRKTTTFLASSEELINDRKKIESGKQQKAATEAMIESAKEKVYALIEELDIKAMEWMSTHNAPDRLEQACKCYEQAIQYTRESLYEENLAERLREYGKFLQYHNQIHKAEASYLEALAIYEQLTATLHEAYEAYVADVLNDLAFLYADTQRFVEAEAHCLRALNIYERLATTQPEIYQKDLALALNYLCVLYSDMQHFEKAEKYGLQALNIYELLASTNTEKYGLHYADALYNIAYFSLFVQKFALAEAYSHEALKWDKDMDIYPNLAPAILLQGRFDEAQQIYLTYKDTLKETFLDDIDTLKENNTIPEHLIADVEKIVKLLQQ
jgi:tetratricopeptide (TPR) repeat protein